MLSVAAPLCDIAEQARNGSLGARSLWAEVDRTEKISAEGGSGSVVTGGGSRRPSVAASAAVGLGDLSRWDANTGEEEEEEHVQQMQEQMQEHQAVIGVDALRALVTGASAVDSMDCAERTPSRPVFAG